MANTGAAGERLKEANNINKSLLTLGVVIAKLSEGTPHVPYRDSKLTRILQNSLGGNAKTAIICAITPAIHHAEETLTSLKFASRAKKIQNSARINEVLTEEAQMKRYLRTISELEQQVEALKGSGEAEALASLKTEKRELSEELGKQNELYRNQESELERLKSLIVMSGSPMKKSITLNSRCISRRETLGTDGAGKRMRSRLSLHPGALMPMSPEFTKRSVSRGHTDSFDCMIPEDQPSFDNLGLDVEDPIQLKSQINILEAINKEQEKKLKELSERIEEIASINEPNREAEMNNIQTLEDGEISSVSLTALKDFQSAIVEQQKIIAATEAVSGAAAVRHARLVGHLEETVLALQSQMEVKSTAKKSEETVTDMKMTIAQLPSEVIDAVKINVDVSKRTEESDDKLDTPRFVCDEQRITTTNTVDSRPNSPPPSLSGDTLVMKSPSVPREQKNKRKLFRKGDISGDTDGATMSDVSSSSEVVRVQQLLTPGNKSGESTPRNKPEAKENIPEVPAESDSVSKEYISKITVLEERIFELEATLVRSANANERLEESLRIAQEAGSKNSSTISDEKNTICGSTTPRRGVIRQREESSPTGKTPLRNTKQSLVSMLTPVRKSQQSADSSEINDHPHTPTVELQQKLEELEDQLLEELETKEALQNQLKAAQDLRLADLEALSSREIELEAAVLTTQKLDKQLKMVEDDAAARDQNHGEVVSDMLEQLNVARRDTASATAEVLELKTSITEVKNEKEMQCKKLSKELSIAIDSRTNAEAALVEAKIVAENIAQQYEDKISKAVAAAKKEASEHLSALTVCKEDFQKAQLVFKESEEFSRLALEDYETRLQKATDALASATAEITTLQDTSRKAQNSDLEIQHFKNEESRLLALVEDLEVRLQKASLNFESDKMAIQTYAEKNIADLQSEIMSLKNRITEENNSTESIKRELQEAHKKHIDFKSIEGDLRQELAEALCEIRNQNEMRVALREELASIEKVNVTFKKATDDLNKTLIAGRNEIEALKSVNAAHELRCAEVMSLADKKAATAVAQAKADIMLAKEKYETKAKRLEEHLVNVDDLRNDDTRRLEGIVEAQLRELDEAKRCIKEIEMREVKLKLEIKEAKLALKRTEEQVKDANETSVGIVEAEVIESLQLENRALKKELKRPRSVLAPRNLPSTMYNHTEGTKTTPEIINQTSTVTKSASNPILPTLSLSNPSPDTPPVVAGQSHWQLESPECINENKEGSIPENMEFNAHIDSGGFTKSKLHVLGDESPGECKQS